MVELLTGPPLFGGLACLFGSNLIFFLRWHVGQDSRQGGGFWIFFFFFYQCWVMKKITLMQCDLPRYLLSTVSCLKVGRRMFERILRTSGEGALGLDSQLLVLQPLVFREASRLEGRMEAHGKKWDNGERKDWVRCTGFVLALTSLCSWSNNSVALSSLVITWANSFFQGYYEN